MSKWKVGECVTVSKKSGEWTSGKSGIVSIDSDNGKHQYGGKVVVNFYDADDNGWGRGSRFWYVNEKHLRCEKTETFTVGTSAELTEAIGLPEQQKLILTHLKGGKNITQLKASHVYHVTNLPDVVMKLRRRGYDISTEMALDEAGSKYASYTLAA